MAQGKLGVLQEQAHIDAAYEELSLLALELDPETLRQAPIPPSLSLRAMWRQMPLRR